MQPALTSNIKDSDEFQKLSKNARAALDGMLQFAMHQRGEWVVEGTPKQLGEWIGSESKLGSQAILAGIKELNENGCIKRAPARPVTRFIVQAPVQEPERPAPQVI